MAGLPPVAENPDWRDGCEKHARYMLYGEERCHHPCGGPPQSLVYAGGGCLRAERQRHGELQRHRPRCLCHRCLDAGAFPRRGHAGSPSPPGRLRRLPGGGRRMADGGGSGCAAGMGRDPGGDRFPDPLARGGGHHLPAGLPGRRVSGSPGPLWLHGPRRAPHPDAVRHRLLHTFHHRASAAARWDAGGALRLR
ncbi:hypothetical protein [Thermoflexus sp.]